MRVIELEDGDIVKWGHDEFKEGWAVARAIKLKQGIWEGPGFEILVLANGAFPWGFQSPHEILKVCESPGPRPYSSGDYFFIKIQRECE